MNNFRAYFGVRVRSIGKHLDEKISFLFIYIIVIDGIVVYEIAISTSDRSNFYRSEKNRHASETTFVGDSSFEYVEASGVLEHAIATCFSFSLCRLPRIPASHVAYEASTNQPIVTTWIKCHVKLIKRGREKVRCFANRFVLFPHSVPSLLPSLIYFFLVHRCFADTFHCYSIVKSLHATRELDGY